MVDSCPLCYLVSVVIKARALILSREGESPSCCPRLSRSIFLYSNQVLLSGKIGLKVGENATFSQSNERSRDQMIYRSQGQSLCLSVPHFLQDACFSTFRTAERALLFLGAMIASRVMFMPLLVVAVLVGPEKFTRQRLMTIVRRSRKCFACGSSKELVSHSCLEK